MNGPLVTYEIYQTVATGMGSRDVKVMDLTCPDGSAERIARFEMDLAPRVTEMRKWGPVIVIRQMREEVTI